MKCLDWVVLGLAAGLLICMWVIVPLVWAETVTPKPGVCRLASLHCWCKEQLSAEAVGADRERFEPVEDQAGSVDSPVRCIEWVDKLQSEREGRTCVAHRACGSTS